MSVVSQQEYAEGYVQGCADRAPDESRMSPLGVRHLQRTNYHRGYMAGQRLRLRDRARALEIVAEDERMHGGT